MFVANIGSLPTLLCERESFLLELKSTGNRKTSNESDLDEEHSVARAGDRLFFVGEGVFLRLVHTLVERARRNQGYRMNYAKRRNPLVAQQPLSGLVTANVYDARQLIIQGDSNFGSARLGDTARPVAVESTRWGAALAAPEHPRDVVLTRRRTRSNRASAASYASSLFPTVNEIRRSPYRP